jgi:hypothetical protein
MAGRRLCGSREKGRQAQDHRRDRGSSSHNAGDDTGPGSRSGRARLCGARRDHREALADEIVAAIQGAGHRARPRQSAVAQRQQSLSHCEHRIRLTHVTIRREGHRGRLFVFAQHPTAGRRTRGYVGVSITLAVASGIAPGRLPRSGATKRRPRALAALPPLSLPTIKPHPGHEPPRRQIENSSDNCPRGDDRNRTGVDGFAGPGKGLFSAYLSGSRVTSGALRHPQKTLEWAACGPPSRWGLASVRLTLRHSSRPYVTARSDARVRSALGRTVVVYEPASRTAGRLRCRGCRRERDLSRADRALEAAHPRVSGPRGQGGQHRARHAVLVDRPGGPRPAADQRLG